MPLWEIPGKVREFDEDWKMATLWCDVLAQADDTGWCDVLVLVDDTGWCDVLVQADVVYRLSLVESFAFGSLISAVDPVATLAIFQAIDVDQILYMLVFGESMLNDAVSIVLTTWVCANHNCSARLKHTLFFVKVCTLLHFKLVYR